ncbi:hypothetical protein CYMTET_28784, partial [Cymbomonas tetramitiformis]
DFVEGLAGVHAAEGVEVETKPGTAFIGCGAEVMQRIEQVRLRRAAHKALAQQAWEKKKRIAARKQRSMNFGAKVVQSEGKIVVPPPPKIKRNKKGKPVQEALPREADMKDMFWHYSLARSLNGDELPHNVPPMSPPATNRTLSSVPSAAHLVEGVTGGCRRHISYRTLRGATCSTLGTGSYGMLPTTHFI